MTTKICTRCKTEWPTSNFHVSRHAKDGFQYDCKPCRKVHKSEWNAQRSLAYRSWENMKQRCLNPKHDSYHYYGARSIAVDPRWLSFDNFLADMGERPEGTSIDRIDPHGNYEPSNCRWADAKTQANNKRRAA